MSAARAGTVERANTTASNFIVGLAPGGWIAQPQSELYAQAGTMASQLAKTMFMVSSYGNCFRFGLITHGFDGFQLRLGDLLAVAADHLLCRLLRCAFLGPLLRRLIL